MYLLEAENLQNLGGPMGTEYTTTMYRKFYRELDNAKQAAEKDYGKPIRWGHYIGKEWTSGDLRWVMYTITLVKTED